MKPRALVIYDSAYGNTNRIAQAITAALQVKYSAKAVLVGHVSQQDVASAELVVIGSPTQGGRPTPALQHWLDELAPDALDRANVAVFDTRFARLDHGFGLRLVMRVLGFAADRIASTVAMKGGIMVAPPEGFIVEDKLGPLRPGELDRAAEWARSLVSEL